MSVKATMSNIKKTFDKLKKEGRKAFIPYIMAGDPSLEGTKAVVRLLEECGADIVELGVPFTDPVADGPVIQRSGERALAQGVTLRDVVALVREIRGFSKIPVILMTYYNPVFQYGLEAFAGDAKEAGVDGLIVPDLPPDEAHDLIKHARQRGIDTVFMLAPTSTPDRVKKVAKAGRGFIYYVSVTGITGARLELEGLADSISALRRQSRLPVSVGFGVSTPEEAQAVAAIADGVIVGSAIVKKAIEGGESLREFLITLRGAIG